MSILAVMLVVTGAVWLLGRDPPEPGSRTSTSALTERPPETPSEVGFDVTFTRGCGLGDLPGFTVPRWITPQSGFVRTDGAAYLQCQIHEWADEGAALADYTQRVALLDGVAAFTRSRQADDRMQRLATVHDGPTVVSFVERSRAADTRSTWISVVRVGDFAGVVTVHSYIDPPPLALQDFEALVAIVLRRMQRAP